MTPPFLGDSFHSCWGLIQAYYPGTPELAHERPDLFIKVQRARHGDLLMLRNNAHCGIYWHGGLLHQFDKNQGVVYETDFRIPSEGAASYRPTIDSFVGRPTRSLEIPT